MRLACQQEAENYVKEITFSNANLEVADIVRFYTKACHNVRLSVVKNCAQGVSNRMKLSTS